MSANGEINLRDLNVSLENELFFLVEFIWYSGTLGATIETHLFYAPFPKISTIQL